METVQNLATKVMTAVSLVTAMGVFMHDGRVDRAALTVLHKPFDDVVSPQEMAQRVKTFVETDAHTHPDHNAARSAYMNSFTYQSPSVPPRKEHHHKFILSEIEAGGRHAFDNANLPLID